MGAGVGAGVGRDELVVDVSGAMEPTSEEVGAPEVPVLVVAGGGALFAD
jgi:hypothetical protein